MLEMTLLMYGGLAAGSSQRGAGLSIRLAFEVHLCHLLLLVKDLLVSLRLFLVEGAVASKWKALTDAVIETQVGRKQIFQICA